MERPPADEKKINKILVALVMKKLTWFGTCDTMGK